MITARAGAIAGYFEVTTCCPSCGADRLRGFYRQAGVPSHSCLLVDDLAAARSFPRGDVELAVCSACGFICNVAVDTSLQAYSASYEETQGFSPRFQEFAHGLAADLVERFDLHGKTVLEIGCGKAEFLADVCELGDNRGIGIDPAIVPDRIAGAAAERIKIIQDYYGEKYTSLSADYIICRHTLEHIADVGDFMRLLRGTLRARKEKVGLFFELPETIRVLREVAFWDIYYEHCSYFSPGSLARLFRNVGFEVEDVSLAYDDQYILLYASPGGPAAGPSQAIEENAEDMVREVDAFVGKCETELARWSREMEEITTERRRAVLWGSGSKGVAFLNTLPGADRIEYVVDINPYKHGKFMPGTGQEIVSPERLRDHLPDVVVAMNPIYMAEIQATLDQLEVGAELRSV